MTTPLDPDMFDPICPSSAMPIQIGVRAREAHDAAPGRRLQV